MKLILEEYGVLIFFLLLFGMLLSYFYELRTLAANGNMMNMMKNQI